MADGGATLASTVLVTVISTTPCRRCGEDIASGDAAVHRFTLIATEIPRMFYHPRCLLDVDADTLVFSLDPSAAGETDDEIAAIVGPSRVIVGKSVNVEGREALYAAAKARVQQLEKIRRESVKRRSRKVVEGGKKVRRKDEIAVDRKGRPRVGVLFAFVGRDGFGGEEGEEQVLPDKTLRSSLREYVLIESGKYAPLEIPWQPNIGALMIVRAGARVTHHALQRLLTWASYDLPAPVLWIVGPDAAERDASEQKLRALIDEAGMVGDEARVVCTDRFDDGGVVALGLALDEALSIEAPDAVSVDPREKLVAMLESTVREKRTGGYARALALVSNRLRGMTPEMKARAADCAIACMRHKHAFSSGFALLAAQPHRRGQPELRALLGDILRGSRVVTKDASSLWGLLCEWEDAGRYEAVLEVVLGESKASARSLPLLGWLESCSDRSIGERLAAFGAKLSETDTRRARALEIADKIVSRAARAPSSKPSGKSKATKKASG